jgi:hypothetical protein
VNSIWLQAAFFRLPASGCISDKTNIACFAVFARRKNARSRADDGVFRQTPTQDLYLSVLGRCQCANSIV